MREGSRARPMHQCFPQVWLCQQRCPRGSGVVVGIWGMSWLQRTRPALGLGGAVGRSAFARAVPSWVFPVPELARSEPGRAPSLAAGCNVPVPKNTADVGAAGFLPRGSFAVLFYTFQVLLGKYVWQRVLCAEQPRALCRPRERGDPYSLHQIAVLSRSPAIRYSALGLPSHLPAPRTH